MSAPSRMASAWRVRRGVDGPATWKVLKTGVVIAAVAIPLQILAGDLHGLNTLEHQPAKIAAMEAVWETERGAAFTVLGLPDEEAGKTHLALKIPKAASLILTHELDGEVQLIDVETGETRRLSLSPADIDRYAKAVEDFLAEYEKAIPKSKRRP